MADAVVIGAGHNGLACGCYLARAGLDVAVFEEYPSVGGMTLTEELTARGFRSDVHASGYQLASLSPTPHELNLFDHGLELMEPRYAWAHAFPGGGCIAVGADLERAREGIARYSPRDADTAVGGCRSGRGRSAPSWGTACARARAGSPSRAKTERSARRTR